MTKTVLTDYLANAGPHPWRDDGWQIAFDFGAVQASISYTSDTYGVEMMVWGMFSKPLEYVKPAQALAILKWLLWRTLQDQNILERLEFLNKERP